MTDSKKRRRMRRAYQAAKYLKKHRGISRRTMYRLIQTERLFADIPSTHKTSICLGYEEKDQTIECLKSLGIPINCKTCPNF